MPLASFLGSVGLYLLLFALFVGIVLMALRGRGSSGESNYHIPPGVKQALRKHWMYDDPD